jgi:phosphocarrier protein HPr
MVKKEITVKNLGLDSKTAALFIQQASHFDSSIFVEKGERRANAKSLLGLLSLGIAQNSVISIVIEGRDEEKASEVLEEFLVKSLAQNQD